MDSTSSTSKIKTVGSDRAVRSYIVKRVKINDALPLQNTIVLWRGRVIC
jgi:hypothetical protein